VAGFEIQPDSKASRVDVVVPGKYRWIPASRRQEATLQVGEVVIPPGGRAELKTGIHVAMTRPVGVGGNLVLALQPTEDGQIYSFIDSRQLERLYGSR